MRLFRCPDRIFITSLRWPRHIVEMQGIELVAIFSLLSSLFSLFFAPSSLLSSALDSRNRIPAFLQGIMRPRGVLHCKNEAIRGGPGANKPCCQSIWGSLAAFFVISSLFSLLASLAAARPGKVQTLLQYSCSSVVHYFHKGLPASVCALPASPFSSFHFCSIPLCVTNMGKCKPCCSAVVVHSI